MEELIKKLAKARDEAAAAKNNLDAMMLAVTSTPEYNRLHDLRDKKNHEIDELSYQIKAEGSKKFESDPENKHPHPALTVKMYDGIIYNRTGEELHSWCLKNLPGVLEVNFKKLDAAAKAGLVSIATVTKVPTVQIKQDLSEWLDG